MGQYTIGGSAARDFTAVLSGGTPAQYEITIHGDTTLAQVMGWWEPALDAVALKEVVFGNDYAEGNTSLRNMAFAAVVFKGGGQSRSNVAFLSDETFSFPKMMSGLQGTPLADLELARPGFVLVPQENAGTAIKLPEAVTRHVGVPALDLKPGLNLVANGKAYGDLAALLERLGIDPTNLPIVGTLDPAILSGAEQVAQPFLDRLDVRIPVKNARLPGIADSVTASDGYLALKGIQKGIDASIASKLTVDAGTSGHAVFNASLRLVKAASGNTVKVTGGYPGEWRGAFGIQWLNVRNLTIDGSLGPTNALQVVGTTDISAVKNLTVTVDLAPKGDVRVTGGEISAADIPGLSSIPHVGDLKFRDLVVSAGAVGGTVRSTTLSWLHDVQAIAFEVGGHWNLAALLGDIDLSRLIKLPPFAQPVLGKLKLGKAALLLSAADMSGRVAALPSAAQARLQDIYGSPDSPVQAAKGVNVVSRFDPSSMGLAATSFVPAGRAVVL